MPVTPMNQPIGLPYGVGTSCSTTVFFYFSSAIPFSSVRVINRLSVTCWAHVKYFLFDWLIIKYICRNVGLRQDAQAQSSLVTYWSRTQQGRRDWLQQFCLRNILLHAQKDANDAKTFLKHFSRLVAPHLRTSVAEIKWMVAKTLFILFLLHNIILDNSQCAAP